jgi:hypothetical protein
MPRGEVRAAVASAAGLYFVGATLIGTSFLLPEVSSPAGAAAVAGTAYLTCALLMLAVVRDRASLMLACVADLWGIVLIVVLCASTGGASSPFAMLYFFAIGHASAFQPRGRFVAVTLVGLLAFLAPLAYSDVSATFGAIVCVGAVLALLTVGAIHIALDRMREQRRRLEFLISATASLDTSLDPHQTLRRIAGMGVPDLAELCVIDVLGAGGVVTESVADATDQVLAERAEALHAQHPPDARGSGPIDRALASGRVHVIDARDEALDARDGAGGAARPGGASGTDGADGAGSDPHDELMRNAGMRTIAAIPMVARGRLLGTISFLRPRPFTSGQLALLEDLTGRASLAFDNARLYAERAHVAHTLRHSLMPAALPTVPGIELESFFRPMSAGSEVGGDFYDVFSDSGDCWLVIGDVCGKGPEAAVLTGFLRHTTVAYAREGVGPGRVLERVNQAMLEHDFEERFATAILARLRFGDGGVAVTLAAAGHPAALVARADGRAEELGGFGTLLGVFPDPVIPESSSVLGPGDALALYTDGLAEAHAPAGVVTVEEMIEALGRAQPGSARETIDTLLGLVDLEDGGRDDIAILALQVDSVAQAPRVPPASPIGAGAADGVGGLGGGRPAAAAG